MSDKITLAKKTLYSKPIGVIILGAANRPSLDEPRSLIQLKNTNLIQHQIKIIKDLFHTPDLIFVGGYQLNQIKKELPKNIRIGENNQYETTNIGKSLAIGLDINILDSVLIVYGDMFFQHDIFDHLHTDVSSAIYSNNKNKKQEVGVIVNGTNVETFSYNSKSKWAQIAYLTGDELKIFKNLCEQRENHTLTGFEILNTVINVGGSIKAVETETEFFTDIDTIDDVRKVRRYINKGIIS